MSISNIVIAGHILGCLRDVHLCGGDLSRVCVTKLCYWQTIYKMQMAPTYRRMSVYSLHGVLVLVLSCWRGSHCVIRFYSGRLPVVVRSVVTGVLLIIWRIALLCVCVVRALQYRFNKLYLAYRAEDVSSLVLLANTQHTQSTAYAKQPDARTTRTASPQAAARRPDFKQSRASKCATTPRVRRRAR